MSFPSPVVTQDRDSTSRLIQNIRSSPKKERWHFLQLIYSSLSFCLPPPWPRCSLTEISLFSSPCLCRWKVLLLSTSVALTSMPLRAYINISSPERLTKSVLLATSEDEGHPHLCATKRIPLTAFIRCACFLITEFRHTLNSVYSSVNSFQELIISVACKHSIFSSHTSLHQCKLIYQSMGERFVVTLYSRLNEMVLLVTSYQLI